MVTRKISEHEKPMMSYIAHARTDAFAVADFLCSIVDQGKAKRIYESFSFEDLIRFEWEERARIAEFLGKTERERPKYARQVLDSTTQETLVVFLTLAALALLRVVEVLELRDRFRRVLAPGCPNRATAAAIFEFASEVTRTASYAWPEELFEE